MYIDKYKQKDGSYVDVNGCHHDDAKSFLQCHILGFCGCGAPEDSLRYIRDCLRHIANLKQVHEKQATYEAWGNEGKELMGRAEYFTRYVLDQKGLTEHGTSIKGAWLTDKGREILADIDTLLAN